MSDVSWLRELAYNSADEADPTVSNKLHEIADRLHSASVALMAAEATLSMLKRVTHDIEYLEVRRRESAEIVRKALAEMESEG